MDKETLQAWLAEVSLCTSLPALEHVHSKLKIGTHWSWGYEYDLGTWACLNSAIMLKRRVLETALKGMPRAQMEELFGANEYYDGTEGGMKKA